jgi:hypothetical protein
MNASVVAALTIATCDSSECPIPSDVVVDDANVFIVIGEVTLDKRWSLVGDANSSRSGTMVTAALCATAGGGAAIDSAGKDGWGSVGKAGKELMVAAGGTVTDGRPRDFGMTTVIVVWVVEPFCVCFFFLGRPLKFADASRFPPFHAKHGLEQRFFNPST